MVYFPNAKINIGLFITEKRADGFHNIESCFYPIGWSDVLEILPSDKLSFKSTGIDIPGEPSGNLCLKAYELLKKDFDIPPVSVHLHKVVPIGAGMGGGSSDGAFTIKTLNYLFELGLSLEVMENYARKLGSDCAFFIQNRPQFCFGKGDEFSEIDLNLTGKYIVLVNPNIHISTVEAYSGIKPKASASDLKETLKLPIQEWKNLVHNDFEQNLFPRFPILGTIKESLYESGASFASMTGSGSTIYGIFEKEVDLRNMFDNYAVWQSFL